MERPNLRLSSAVLFVVLLCATAAAASDPERISVSSTGSEAHPAVNACCSGSAVNADGRFVAFASNAPDLVPGDTNSLGDVFVRDRLLGMTTRVNVSSAGRQANDFSILRSISADGRYVLFSSRASNLVPDDTNGQSDEFVHDRTNGTTVRVSTGLNGEQLGLAFGVAMSADGRFLAVSVSASTVLVRDRDVDADGIFDESGATSAVALDLSGAPRVSASDRYPPIAISADGRFVVLSLFGTWGQRLLLHDRDKDENGTFDESGTLETRDLGDSSVAVVTPDGRFLAFNTRAALVAEDTNGTNDVYIYDRISATTRRVSVTSAGAQAPILGDSHSPGMSATGRFVAFISEGPLVPHDTNFSRDIYLHDRDADQDQIFDEPGAIATIRMSENANGDSPQGFSGGVSISLDGSYVAFSTFASDLVAGDTNGAVDVFVSRLNLAPVLGTITGPELPVTVGTAIAVQSAFTDVNTDDTHIAQWNWGDGSTSGGVITGSAGGGSIAGAHTYPAPGVYAVTLTLTDAEGAIVSSRYEYVVVYDPSGGFVSGNGLIASPAGAFAADPTLTGPARVSFVSRYQPGTNAPDGNMQFDFKVADFTFRANGYAWLVVSGPRAQIKGTGAINGAGTYEFLLSVVDGEIPGGGSDRVRVKIWDPGTGTTVYDNQLGAANDATATTVITGGSIVIHK